MGNREDDKVDPTQTQRLEPERVEDEVRAALEAKAKRFAALMGDEAVDGTVRMSQTDQAKAGEGPAVPFSGESEEPASSVDDGPDWRSGATVSTDGPPPISTPFNRSSAPRAQRPPVPSLAEPAPVHSRRVASPMSLGEAAPAQPEVTEVPLAIPQAPLPSEQPAVGGARPKPIVERPDPLDDPDTYNTPDTRKAARDLAALMTTENDGLARFRQRHLAGDEPLTQRDVVHMRDILRALAFAMKSPDADTGDRLREAWRLLFEEARAIRKRTPE